MNNMVLATIASGELTEKQTEKVNEVCKTFGDSFKSLASVFVRYAELNDKIDVAFCDYVHHALEKLSTSKIKNKNKVFAEMTGVEYTKVTKCNKVYTDVMTAVKLSTANEMGYDTVSEVFTEYSFSQLYTLTAIQCGATIEKLIKRNICNYTVAEIRFIIENIKAKNPVEDVVDDEISKRIHYIGQGLDIKNFNNYVWNESNGCYEAIARPDESKTDESKADESKTDESKADESKALDINAILDYIRKCENPIYLNSIKVATAERIKAIKK